MLVYMNLSYTYIVCTRSHYINGKPTLENPVPFDIYTTRDRPNLRWFLKFFLRSFIGEHFLKKFPPDKSMPRKLLNLGCGPMRFKEFVNADFYSTRILNWGRNKSRRPDWMVDVRRPLRCQDNYWEGVFSEHLIEHLTYSDAKYAFSEILRTLKPDCWLRVTVPDLEKFAQYYLTGKSQVFGTLPRQWTLRAEAIADITQMWGHQSVWDQAMMKRVLSEVGFVNVQVQEFRYGNNPDLLQDDPGKKWETLYVEAQKPNPSR